MNNENIKEEYIKLKPKERSLFLSDMSEKEKYEFLSKIPKKDLSEDEKLFLMKVELNLYAEQVAINKEKEQKEWIKNILAPLKLSLEKIYKKNNEEILDDEMDLKISAYLVKILEDDSIINNLSSVNYNDYVFKNKRNKIDRIEKKKKSLKVPINSSSENKGENRVE